MKNPVDRIQRIGMTGDIEDPKPLSPVENIMQHYPKQEKTQDSGFWDGVKNFAASKGGRMLIGGLGTGAAVALTGGSLGNALGYGVIGAGKTADNLYQKEQDQKTWEEKEAERLFRQQENEANRQHDWDIANAKIKADAEARKDTLEKVITELNLKKELGAFDKKGDSLSGLAEWVDYMAKSYNWTPEQSIAYYGKMTPEEKLDFHEKKGAIDTANKIAVANNEFGNKSALQDDAQAYGFEMEDKKHGNKLEAMGADYGYKSKLQEQKDIAKMRLEEFKSRIPTPQQKNIEAQAKALNIDPAVIYQTMKDKEDALIEKIIAESGRTGAQTDYTNAQTEFLTGAKTDLTNAQAGLTNARTGLTEAQTGQVGKTNDIRNAEWLANNPNATMEQKIAMGVSGSYGKAYNDAIMTGKTPEEANNIAMAKVQQDIITGQLMSGMLGGIPNGQSVAPVYPQESEDVEYVTF